MIKDLKQTAVHLGKYKIPVGRFPVAQAIDFECHAERDGHSVTMSIIASYQLIRKEDGEIALNVPCSTTIEFMIDSPMTVEELMPIWKSSVKNLRDKCNDERKEPLKNIPYPSNDQVKESIASFLKEFDADT